MTYYAFAGNIATGKSACARLLADELRVPLVQERVETHPYLSQFYADPEKWAFHLEMFNLADRSRAILEARRIGSFILDRSYEEDIVYVETAREQNNITADEFGIYRQLFHVALGVLPVPTKIFYLRVSDLGILLDRVRTRSRSVESTVSVNYLRDLQAKYDRWFQLYERPKQLVDVSAGSPQSHVETILADLI